MRPWRCRQHTGDVDAVGDQPAPLRLVGREVEHQAIAEVPKEARAARQDDVQAHLTDRALVRGDRDAQPRVVGPIDLIAQARTQDTLGGDEVELDAEPTRGLARSLQVLDAARDDVSVQAATRAGDAVSAAHGGCPVGTSAVPMACARASRADAGACARRALLYACTRRARTRRSKAGSVLMPEGCPSARATASQMGTPRGGSIQVSSTARCSSSPTCCPMATCKRSARVAAIS